jgi:hypothetical protein
MKRQVLYVLAVAAVAMAWCSLASGDGEKGSQDAVSRGAKVNKAAVDEAVKKACEWLKSQQQPDGSWTDAGKHYDMLYPFARTAFVLFALLKGTETGESECIKKGFDWIKSQIKEKKDFPSVYAASALIMALCALWEPSLEEPEKADIKPGEKLRTVVFDPLEYRMKKKFKEASYWEQELLKRAVRWLIAQQTETVWRYPGMKPGDYGPDTTTGGNQDASNTQYAMLALYMADMVGVKAPVEVYQKVAEYFIKQQEKEGPEVKPFPVPAADLSITMLKKKEKEMLDELRKDAETAVKQGKPVSDRGPHTVVIEPEKEFGPEGVMKARGWAYLPQGQRSYVEFQTQVTGSMTTSGTGSLLICKAKLEGTDWYKNNENRKNLCRAIRDGMAWLAHNFTVTDNPGPLKCWKYYYLYGIERCGVLALSRKIGEHFWYEEGAQHILKTQAGDGSWPGATLSSGGEVKLFDYGPVYPTCFCILFLKRATAPVVNFEPIYTGEGLLPGGSKREE